MNINLSEDLQKAKVLLNFTNKELAYGIGVNRITLSR